MLFNAIVNQSLAVSDLLTLEKVNCTYSYIQDIDPQVDFMVRFDKNDTIEFDFEFDIYRYSKNHIQRIIKSFIYSLRYISTDPHILICNVPLLTSLDSSKVTIFWNRTEHAYDRNACLQGLVEEAVRKAPYNIALIYEGLTLTYEELNTKANQLAHYLRKLGVGKETLVGISLERSMELMIGLLAILKAGGAYVPLDPSYPAERLQWMLTDAKPLVLITCTPLSHKFSDYT